MGLTYADIEVENLFSRSQLAVKARVESGALFLSVPEHVAMQLGFDLIEVATREVVLANGHREVVPMIETTLRLSCCLGANLGSGLAFAT